MLAQHLQIYTTLWHLPDSYPYITLIEVEVLQGQITEEEF
jgi:hypothetical protein